MLTPEDRRAIEGLFRRLADIERRAEPRDPEAEALIRAEIARQPGAAYYMAQTILVQEHALSVAQERVRELEAEVARREPSDMVPQRGPWDRDGNRDERRSSGFLAGAAQTALGVTGGVLLGSAIASMFGVGAANAGEASPEPQHEPEPPDEGGDAGDFGDFDGFDFGGDF